jgi:hypothetical protein
MIQRVEWSDRMLRCNNEVRQAASHRMPSESPSTNSRERWMR